MFWILVLGLLLTAAGFVLWPFRRGAQARPSPPERDEVVRALYRDRLAELGAEADATRLDDATRAQVVEELGANLLDDYRPAEAGGAEPRPPASGRVRAAGWLAALLVPLTAAGVYLSVGEPGAAEIAGAAEVLQLDPDGQRAEIEAWERRLTRRVARQPDDAQSWYLLGTSRLQLGHFEPAADAFAAAHELIGADPNVDLYWLQARYLAAEGRLDPVSRDIANRVLARDPSHPLVLEVLAIDAYRKGDFRQAVTHLNRALSNELAPAQLAALLGGMNQARRQLGDLQPSIDVSVSAAAGAPNDATLFVIARPPGGGMPYAVVRRPAALLPMTIRLDDAVSMNPQMPLSAAGQVEVVVRISRSGMPAAQPDDWSWQSEPIAPAELRKPERLDAVLTPPDLASAGD